MAATDHPSIFSPSTLVKKGYCACATTQDRAPNPHNLYYELHGAKEDVRERIVLIMGLNASSFSWSNNLSYLAEKPHCQVLAFDNRGVGLSDAPVGYSKRYKTSEMALDTIELFDHLGWTGNQSIHVVGVSMGGMIAQHVALLALGRIASLVLISTTSDNRRLAPMKGVSMLLRNMLPTYLGGPSTPEDQIALAVSVLYPASYLDETITDPSDRNKTITKRQLQQEEMLARYRLVRMQTPAGRMGQLGAALTHYVSPEQLAMLDKTVPKIVIITGDDDNLVDPSNSYKMKQHMPTAEFVLYEQAGHALPGQKAKELNELIHRSVGQARSRCA